MHACLCISKRIYGAFRWKDKRSFFFSWYLTRSYIFNSTAARLSHKIMSGQKTPFCQCAGSSHFCAGYYSSIVEHLSELEQTALSTAVSHWARYSDALLKYDTTLPRCSSLHTMWNAASLSVLSHRVWMTHMLAGFLLMLSKNSLKRRHTETFFLHVQWIRSNYKLHVQY